MNKVKDIIRRLEQEKDSIKRIVIADELLTEVTKVRNELARSYRWVFFYLLKEQLLSKFSNSCSSGGIILITSYF